MKIETQAIHAGFDDDPTTRAVAAPIYQTTSYSFRDTQHGADLFNLAEAGNIYTRIMNPTSDILEQRVAAMEGGAAALCVASGMAAITAAMQTLCAAGDNFVSVSQLYGGTYNLFAHTFPQQGIEVKMASGDDIAALEALIDDNTKAIFCESIGNPAGNIIDLTAVSEMAHKHQIPVVVDNTVATPYLCRPFEHGADIVVHSLTKYIGGHGTSVGGIIVDSGKFPFKDNPRIIFEREFTRINNNSANTRTMTANIFSQRVNNNICTMLKRSAQVRSSNCIINYYRDLVLMRHLRNSGKINNITCWVANRFAENGLSVVIDQCLKSCNVITRCHFYFNALLRESVSK